MRCDVNSIVVALKIISRLWPDEQIHIYLGLFIVRPVHTRYHKGSSFSEFSNKYFPSILIPILWEHITTGLYRLSRDGKFINYFFWIRFIFTVWVLQLISFVVLNWHGIPVHNYFVTVYCWLKYIKSL